MTAKPWRTHNPAGSKRVIVTKELPGARWLDVLTQADCRVEICTSPDILSIEEVADALGFLRLVILEEILERLESLDEVVALFAELSVEIGQAWPKQAAPPGVSFRFHFRGRGGSGIGRAHRREPFRGSSPPR